MKERLLRHPVSTVHREQSLSCRLHGSIFGGGGVAGVYCDINATGVCGGQM